MLKRPKHSAIEVVAPKEEEEVLIGFKQTVRTGISDTYGGT